MLNIEGLKLFFCDGSSKTIPRIFCIEIKEELYIVYLHDKMYTILLIELLYNLEQSSQKME